MTTTSELIKLFEERFGDELDLPREEIADLSTLEAMARRRSFRRFKDEPVSVELLKLLAATALSAPTKSDLQQRDIIIVKDGKVRAALNELLMAQDWIADAPEMLVFCGNNRRQRQIHEWRERPFVNDHLDALFNAAVDAGIALQAFVTAAESTGLGCAPISAIRNDSQAVSDILGLPDHVFAVAGLGLGWPAHDKPISMRLPLSSTVHIDRFGEEGIAEAVAGYDAARAERQPMRNQREPERFGVAEPYTWSEDKARQYASPERAEFGSFVKKKGFRLI
jgi:nitroreductase/FMN reductase [NAD(P)H]